MPTPAPHGHGTTRLAPHRRFWPRRVPFDLPAAQTTLWDNLDISARRYPDKPAFVFFGRALGFAQLRAQAQRLAGWLHSKAGVREGDRRQLGVPIGHHPHGLGLVAFALHAEGLALRGPR